MFAGAHQLGLKRLDRRFGFGVSCQPSCSRAVARDGSPYYKFDGYPPVARIGRIKGSVTVAAIVDEQGRVKSARATSGNPVLQKAAVDHITNRRYRPAQKDGVPVKVQIIVQVNFKG